MNHYYAEFHARDRIEQFHREADGSQRASQAQGRRRDRSANRSAPRSFVTALFSCSPQSWWVWPLPSRPTQERNQPAESRRSIRSWP